jgi:hypothetical protein
MAHTHREFRTEDIPLAYLISFRAYGTWLHGDRRGSVDRLWDEEAVSAAVVYVL